MIRNCEASGEGKMLDFSVLLPFVVISVLEILEFFCKSTALIGVKFEHLRNGGKPLTIDKFREVWYNGGMMGFLRLGEKDD